MPRNTRKRRKPVALERLPGTAGALELAEGFSVSSNAVRPHLPALERDRLVRHASETRGVGKPTHVYELTPEGQYLLSRAYAPALAYILRAAQHRIAGPLDDVLRDAGDRQSTR